MKSLIKIPRAQSKLCTIFFLMVLLLVWSCFILFSGNNRENLTWYMKSAPCKLPDKTLTEMVELTLLIHDVLDKQQVAHVLCFGTLWGALRFGTLLPWDNNVDICVSQSEIEKASSSDMVQLLKEKGAQTTYNSRYGFYEIRYQTVTGFINILHGRFSLGEPMMMQIGWGRWSIFSSQKQFSVPSRLMEKPFPTVRFYDRQMPVPHEDIEMMKYLYPNDWWIEVKPLGCIS